ncbi:MAG: nuclear transport factor 2 family protein [Acidobacteriota bacterium]
MKLLFSCLLMTAFAFGQKPTVEQRLQQLEDKAAIEQVLIDYGRTLDSRDLVAYSELFAKEGEWIGGFGDVKGRAALLDFMKKNIGTALNAAKTYHLLTNFTIEVHGDRATALSRWSYVVPNADKKPVLEHSGRYEDALIREDGRWRFLKRVVYNDLPQVQH